MLRSKTFFFSWKLKLKDEKSKSRSHGNSSLAPSGVRKRHPGNEVGAVPLFPCRPAHVRKENSACAIGKNDCTKTEGKIVLP